MEVIVLVISMLWLFVVGFGLGRYTTTKYETNTIKRENERLNAELKKLTDRDERGRFKGAKK